MLWGDKIRKYTTLKRHESKQNLLRILALPSQKRGACAHLAPTGLLTLIGVLVPTLSKLVGAKAPIQYNYRGSFIVWLIMHHSLHFVCFVALILTGSFFNPFCPFRHVNFVWFVCPLLGHAIKIKLTMWRTL